MSMQLVRNRSFLNYIVEPSYKTFSKHCMDDMWKTICLQLNPASPKFRHVQKKKKSIFVVDIRTL